MSKALSIRQNLTLFYNSCGVKMHLIGLIYVDKYQLSIGNMAGVHQQHNDWPGAVQGRDLAGNYMPTGKSGSWARKMPLEVSNLVVRFLSIAGCVKLSAGGSKASAMKCSQSGTQAVA